MWMNLKDTLKQKRQVTDWQLGPGVRKDTRVSPRFYSSWPKFLGIPT